MRMFKPQFAALVVSGAKRQTIRPTPKRMPKVGDVESWREWSGLPYRSKQRELAQVRLTSVEEIIITSSEVVVNGWILPSVSVKKLALKDGFLGKTDFIGWFNYTHGLPFTGIIIEAEDAR